MTENTAVSNPDVEEVTPEKAVCPKCASQNLREETKEIVVFRDSKPFGVVSARPGCVFHICNGCGNVIALDADVNFRKLNRAERRRIEVRRKKGGR